MPGRYLLAAFFVVLALGGGAWFLVNGLDGAPAAPQSATVFPEPRPLPEFRLVDHRNEPCSIADLEGHTSLLFFGFTHCPDICPETLQQLALARRQLAAGSEPLPEIVLISVDPERDTAAILKAYTGHFGEGVSGVSGDAAELQKLASALGIYYAREDSAGPDYNVSHSTAVLLINREAELQALFTAPLDTEALVSDLQALVDAR